MKTVRRSGSVSGDSIFSLCCCRRSLGASDAFCSRFSADAGFSAVAGLLFTAAGGASTALAGGALALGALAGLASALAGAALALGALALGASSSSSLPSES